MILQLEDKGPNVTTLQNALNDLGKSRGFPPLHVDGDLGEVTWGAWRDIFKALGGWGFTGSVDRAERRWEIVIHPQSRTKVELGRAATWRKQTAKVRANRATLRERAWDEAGKLVGVMEEGGNNRGAKVTEIIRANGGAGPEPWCGDFVAYCYRKAGSKLVTRAWASVYFLGRIGGLVRTKTPRRGDIVRYTFDHTGLYGSSIGGGQFVSREGNTGASGAVSDSSTGGDGVYEKHRPFSVVNDFRKVTK